MSYKKFGYSSMQEFLDNVQYARDTLLGYEKIFGYTYVSTGGETTTAEFCADLPLNADSLVLDVGCGIGGSAFYLSKKYGCKVKGIDLSTNMISIGQDRLTEAKLQDKVELTVQDCTTVEYPDQSFDLIYSRDTILHIEDKESLFRNFHKWLKPGGVVLITDYCCSPKPWTDAYASYVEQRGYFLLTVPEYGTLLEKTGFSDVKSIDKTNRFLEILRLEQDKIASLKDKLIKEDGEKIYVYLCEGWKNKIERSTQGNQRWGLFIAKKN